MTLTLSLSFILAGFLLLLTSFAIRRSINRKYRRCTKVVNAEVISHRSWADAEVGAPARNSMLHAPVYAFTHIGKRYEICTNRYRTKSAGLPEIGTKCQIRCNPAVPSEIIDSSKTFEPLAAMLFAGTGIVLLLLGIIICFVF